jgi:prepilin-type N-terminal cleavage/methylation domain-containing protein
LEIGRNAPQPKKSGKPLRGFTLVEMLVVVVIISIMSVAIVAEMHGTFQDALLRSTSRELAGACNVASSRAISVNRPHRIRLDRLAHRYFLERSTRGGSDFFPRRILRAVQELSTPASPSPSEPGVNAAGRRRPGTVREFPGSRAIFRLPSLRKRPSPFIRTARPMTARSNWLTAMVSAWPCASTPSPRACKSRRWNTHEREASPRRFFFD